MIQTLSSRSLLMGGPRTSPAIASVEPDIQLYATLRVIQAKEIGVMILA